MFTTPQVNTALQFGLLGLTLSHFAFDVPAMHLIEPMWWITATTTLWSGLGYLDGSGIRRVGIKDLAKPLSKGTKAS